MFAVSVLIVLIQAAFIVHVVKTGRNMLWVMAIGLLPLVGILAYLIVEILPGMFASTTARRARSGVRRLVNPDRDLRRARAEVEISGNVDARRRLAEELFDRARYDAAIDIYQGGLQGIFEHDPALLFGLAQAHYARADFPAARAALERMAEHNPEFTSAEAQLLYARTLEAGDALEAAERAYAKLAPAYPGAEARLRYALLLKRRGKMAEAQSVLRDLVDGARLAPAHYRKAQAEWLERARREMS